jgi:hypothetical protein
MPTRRAPQGGGRVPPTIRKQRCPKALRSAESCLNVHTRMLSLNFRARPKLSRSGSGGRRASSSRSRRGRNRAGSLSLLSARHCNAPEGESANVSCFGLSRRASAPGQSAVPAGELTDQAILHAPHATHAELGRIRGDGMGSTIAPPGDAIPVPCTQPADLRPQPEEPR